MSAVTIADAHESDIGVLTALYKTARAHSDLSIVPDYFRSFSDAMFRDVWEEHFQNSSLYKSKVAWFNNEAVGFCRTGALDEDYLPLLKDFNLGASSGELHQIYILPEHQKNGLGRLLYKHAFNDLAALNYKNFIICTYTENENAKAFYNKMGAKPLIDSILTIKLSGQDWQRPVSFLIQKI